MTNLFTLYLAIIILLFFSCNSKKINSDKTVFKYNESAGITSLDPAFARNQANIWAVNQIFNGLVQLDDSLNIKPSIAKNWNISNDLMIYTFILRDDVFFHDSKAFENFNGRRVVANDFVYSFNRLADETLMAPGAWVVSNIEKKDKLLNIKAINDTILQIKLKSAFPPFLGLLTTQYCSVVPHEAVDYYGEKFRSNPVGTGAFKFANWKENVKLVLVKNDNYFEYDQNNKLPYLDAVSISFIIDKQTAFLEFIKGNIDFISGIDASYKDELLSFKGELSDKYKNKINLIKSPYLNTEYLAFLMDTNNSIMKKNPLKSILIRKAINYAIDRDKMLVYLRNNIGFAGYNGIIPRGLQSFNKENKYGYCYNPELAKELIKQATIEFRGEIDEITLSTNASYLDISQFIQNQLALVGLKVKLDISPPATLRENIAQMRIPFFRGSWIADYPDAENYLSLFYSKNRTPIGPNFTAFSNKKFDELYLESLKTNNIYERKNIYCKMDSIIMTKAAIVVLYYDEVYRFSQNNIEGLGINSLNLLNLKKVKKHNINY